MKPWNCVSLKSTKNSYIFPASLVYDKRWNPQEIEFTFEGPEPEELYLLQTRDMITIKKKEHLNVFVESPALESAHLGKGVGRFRLGSFRAGGFYRRKYSQTDDRPIRPLRSF